MDPRQEKAIRRIMANATENIIAILNISPERLPAKIDETVTEALEKEGVTEGDIGEALRK